MEISCPLPPNRVTNGSFAITKWQFFRPPPPSGKWHTFCMAIICFGMGFDKRGNNCLFISLWLQVSSAFSTPTPSQGGCNRGVEYRNKKIVNNGLSVLKSSYLGYRKVAKYRIIGMKNRKISEYRELNNEVWRLEKVSLNLLTVFSRIVSRIFSSRKTFLNLNMNLNLIRWG